MTLRTLFVISCFFTLNLLVASKSRAQSYGLGFLSHEVEAGKRTSLDLFPGQGFDAQADFQLSFDVSFFPEQSDYFGHIFHMEGPKNIGLMYSKSRFVPDEHDPYLFKLINGDAPSKINFNIDKDKIRSQWNKVKLVVEFSTDRLILYINNDKYVENNAHLVKGKYKLVWGTNPPNNDNPPMKVRDIGLKTTDTEYFWPLNEIRGNIAHELQHGQNGAIVNPSWIRAKHRNWTFEKNITIGGMASVAFNEVTGALYIVGQDSLLTYNVAGQKLTAIPYGTGNHVLPPSNRSVYNNADHQLYNYYIDRDLKQVNRFDPDLKKWDKEYPKRISIVDYQQQNNFFSAADTSLYIIGGYGHFIYKNTIFRYNTVTQKLSEVIPHGDNFSPRYLAAAGVADSGRTAYILGGIGNYTGKQILGPKNLYDLIKFDIRTATFKKLYDLKVKGEDLAFASNMIINEKARTFKTLAFPNDRYRSYLRLFSGNLDNPSYQLIGDSIPYKFHDVKGFADIYYNHINKQYIAVTLLTSHDNTSTAINIYTLSDPPDLTIEDSYSKRTYHIPVWSLITGLAGFILLVVYLIMNKKSVTTGISTPPLEAELPAVDAPIAPKIDVTAPEKNALFLFGDMQLINQEGTDVAKQFTPLLKELFLVVLINSLRSGRGISGEKLAELLWPDRSELSARNNRDANLSKLKGLLNQVDHLSIQKEAGNWMITIDQANFYLDYHQYLKLNIGKTADKQNIAALIKITQRGNFLSGFEYPWLDQMKSEISNDIINKYLNYAVQVPIEDDPEFLISITNCIFYLDPVNEEAMIIKCKALSHLGKHSLAKTTFENFVKEFKNLYGEDLKKNFNSIWDPNNTPN